MAQRLARPVARFVPIQSLAGVAIADLIAIAGYALVKSATASLGPTSGDSPFRVVLCRLDDSAEIGFEVERLADGRVVVFVPAAPVPWSGAVKVMESARVEALEGTLVDAVQALRRFGLGTGALLGVEAVRRSGRPVLAPGGEA